MTVARPRSADLLDRRDRRTLPSGMRVYGASRADARYQQFVGDYFRGGLPLRRGMTVLDVGANIGLFSLELLRRCEGDARVLAFEPAPESFAHLSRNLRELFPAAPARAVQQAVSDRRGEATFYFRPRAPCLSSLHARIHSDAPGGDPDALIEAALREPPPEYRGREPRWFQRLPRPAVKRFYRAAGRWAEGGIVETRCRVTTLSEILREHALERVDLLKVDVEGAELAVLRGVTHDDWSRIQRVAVEVHDVDGRLAAVRAILESARFARIAAEQDWPFEGTNVFMVHATRARDGDP
jgi:FkbM family methyltransferase